MQATVSGSSPTTVQPSDHAERLDPRVQRFLRFLAETAVRSLVREREERRGHETGHE
jgi:hypothetical protein